MGLSIANREMILNALFRGGTFTALPNPLYIALLATSPSDETGTGAVEVSTGTWTNYARASIATGGSSGFTAPGGGTTAPQTIDNTGAVSFGTAATTGNVTLTGVAFYSAATAGTWEGWVSLGSVIVQNGDPVQFAIAALIASL